MTESRAKNSAKNAISGLLSLLLTLLISFISRTIFIYVLGEECLGLNGLFTTLLSLFSLAELGIGQAITFYLYKPIAENDHRRLTQLVRFYKLSYRVIALAIAIIGVSIIPILPKIIKLETVPEYNYSLLYLLYLANTVFTYLFFSYPQTILSANQKQYIINNCNLIFAIIGFCVDTLVLILTHNYIIYLSVRLSIGVVSNCCIAIIAFRKYPYLKAKNAEKLRITELREMFKDVYAIFIVKLADKLFSSTDNLFISVMFGTILVGHNSNYLLIINAVAGLVSTCIYSCTGSVGNLIASSTKEVIYERFKLLDYIDFCLSAFCAICLYTLLNPFISLVWGDEFLFSHASVALMCLHFYVTYSLSALFMFRQGMGLFRYYIYIQLFASITNIILNIVLGKLIGIEGIFLATVISSLGLTVIPFVKNLFIIGFRTSPKEQIHLIILRLLFVIIIAVVVDLICRNIPNTFGWFVFRTVIVVSITSLSILLTACKNNQIQAILSYGKSLLNKND